MQLRIPFDYVSSGTDTLGVAAFSEFLDSFGDEAIPLGASTVGLPIVVLGKEDAGPCIDLWITTLTAEQFDAFVRNTPGIEDRTSLVQSRLASVPGGTDEEYSFGTPFGRGFYDLRARGMFYELKFGADKVTLKELSKDIFLLTHEPLDWLPTRSIRNVKYIFVDDPVSPYNGRVSRASLEKLDSAGILNKHYTWNEFLRM